jgi:ABC-type phosphate/phosphonate transport system substrate-binding protein
VTTLVLLSLVGLLPGTGAAADRPLRVTSIPEAAEPFKKGEAAFERWLSQASGQPVELTVAGTYEDAVWALTAGEADLGWLGG